MSKKSDNDQKQPIGQIDPVQKVAKEAPVDDNITVNDKEEWDRVRESWTKQQASRLEAHALKTFANDDELPLSRHFLIAFIVLFWIVLIIWANFAPLDEVTRGDGKVIPSGAVQSLQSLDAGVVEEILVSEGDKVEINQPLLRLNAIEASSDLSANQARFLGLLASITRLQAEAEGKPTVEFPDNVMQGAPQSVTEELNTFRANRQSLQNQLNVLRQQLAQREQEVRELSGRISDTRGVVNLQRQEMEMVRPLVERGSAPRMELLQLERTMKERQTELNGFASSMPRARSAVSEASARIKEIEAAAKAQAQTELSAKLIEMNEIRERLSAMTQRKARTEIKSPVTGTIQELTINTIGGVVNPGVDLIKIVPKDDKLIIEAKIRPADRAFIYPGQKAVIKLTAYDFSIYGGLEGELTDISADTFEDEQGDSFYKVKLRTYDTELKRKGEILPIEVGMVASVDILTGEKTIMQYFLKPLIKTLNNAMNER